MKDNIYFYVLSGLIFVFIFSLTLNIIENIKRKEKQRFKDISNKPEKTQLTKNEKWEQIIIIVNTYYKGEMNNKANQKILRDQYFTISQLEQGIIETYNLLATNRSEL